MATFDEIYEDRCHAIGTAIHAKTGADVYVWFDKDSNRYRCRWRNEELSPQVPWLEQQTVEETYTRIVTAWRDEMMELLK